MCLYFSGEIVVSKLFWRVRLLVRTFVLHLLIVLAPSFVGLFVRFVASMYFFVFIALLSFIVFSSLFVVILLYIFYLVEWCIWFCNGSMFFHLVKTFHILPCVLKKFIKVSIAMTYLSYACCLYLGLCCDFLFGAFWVLMFILWILWLIWWANDGIIGRKIFINLFTVV